MTVMSLRQARPCGRAKYLADAPILIGSSNEALALQIAGAACNALFLTSGQDILAAMEEGGYSALFLDMLPLADGKTGVGIMRKLTESGPLDVPTWLMTDFPMPAQVEFVRKTYGAKGSCLRNLGELLKRSSPDVVADTASSKAPLRLHEASDGRGLSQKQAAELSSLFLQAAGFGGQDFLDRMLNHGNGASIDADVAIRSLAAQLTLPRRKSAFIEAAEQLKKSWGD